VDLIKRIFLYFYQNRFISINISIYQRFPNLDLTYAFVLYIGHIFQFIYLIMAKVITFPLPLLWIVTYIFVCLHRNKQNIKKKRNETGFYHRRTISTDAKDLQELSEVEISSPQGSDIPFIKRSDSGKIYRATFRVIAIRYMHEIWSIICKTREYSSDFVI